MLKESGDFFLNKIIIIRMNEMFYFFMTVIRKAINTW